MGFEILRRWLKEDKYGRDDGGLCGKDVMRFDKQQDQMETPNNETTILLIRNLIWLFNGKTFGTWHGHLDHRISLARIACCRQRGGYGRTESRLA